MKGHCTSCFKYDTLNTIHDFNGEDIYLCKDCLNKRRLFKLSIVLIGIFMIIMFFVSIS